MIKAIEEFVTWGEEFIEPARRWLENNHSNPVLWMGLLGLGVLVFAYTFGTLNKHV